MKKLLYRFHNFKYRYKLMILILIAGIIPTLIVTCYMQMGMMNTLKEREMENMQESLKQAVDAIDNQAQIYENLIDYLSYSGDLRKVLKMERASDFNTYLKYTQVSDPLLNMPQVYHKEIKGITLYADNIQVAHGSTLAPLSEIQGENWYPRNNRSLIRWYVQTGSQNKVIVARKFYDGSSEINAVLKITLDYNKLFEPFEKIMESDFAGIVWDENGNVVYSCNKIPAKYETGKVDTISEVQKSFSSVTKEMEGNQWKFCYFCPTDTIMESARYLMLKNLPLLTACILLIGILSYFFSRRLVCKLEQLTENMNQIHSGIREVTVQSDSKDEIGVLIRTFRRMMNEINKLISEVYEAKIVLQRTEMRALQAQINPHFLNNTLEMMNWQARMSGNLEVSSMIESLGVVLDYNMNRESKRLTTLSQELRCADAYFHIISKRFGKRLTVEKEIDQKLLSIKVPQLVLQPMIENAVVHGIERIKQGIIKIKIHSDVENVYLQVMNSGKPLTKEAKERIETLLNQRPEEIAKEMGHHVSLAIRNINERVKLIYGEEYGLCIEQEGEYIVSTIVIPVREKKVEMERDSRENVRKRLEETGRF